DRSTAQTPRREAPRSAAHGGRRGLLASGPPVPADLGRRGTQPVFVHAAMIMQAGHNFDPSVPHRAAYARGVANASQMPAQPKKSKTTPCKVVCGPSPSLLRQATSFARLALGQSTLRATAVSSRAGPQPVVLIGYFPVAGSEMARRQ